MKSPVNAFAYPDPVWQRFGEPRHAGDIPAGPGVYVAEAGSVASKSLLRLSLRVEQGRIVQARFKAYGCPSAIAVGQWLAESLDGQAVETLRTPEFTAPSIRRVLEISEDRAHCALMGEDAVRELLKQLK